MLDFPPLLERRIFLGIHYNGNSNAINSGLLTDAFVFHFLACCSLFMSYYSFDLARKFH